jgi:hypothetical protein
VTGVFVTGGKVAAARGSCVMAILLLGCSGLRSTPQAPVGRLPVAAH